MTFPVDALPTARLHRTLAAVAAAHPFYRAPFAARGIDASDIGGLDDLEKLPLTSKDDYVADPEAFRLHAEELPDEFGAEERLL